MSGCCGLLRIDGRQARMCDKDFRPKVGCAVIVGWCMAVGTFSDGPLCGRTGWQGEKIRGGVPLHRFGGVSREREIRLRNFRRRHVGVVRWPVVSSAKRECLIPGCRQSPLKGRYSYNYNINRKEGCSLFVWAFVEIVVVGSVCFSAIPLFPML